MLQLPALSPHFQCHLDRTGNLDSLTIRVERRDTALHIADAVDSPYQGPLFTRIAPTAPPGCLNLIMREALAAFKGELEREAAAARAAAKAAAKTAVEAAKAIGIGRSTLFGLLALLILLLLLLCHCGLLCGRSTR